MATGTWTLYSNNGSTTLGTYTGDGINTLYVRHNSVIDNKGNTVTITIPSGQYFIGISSEVNFTQPLYYVGQTANVNDSSTYANHNYYVIFSSYPLDAPKEVTNFKAAGTTLLSQTMSSRNTPIYYNGTSFATATPGHTTTLNTTDKYCKGNIQAGTAIFATQDKLLNSNLAIQKVTDDYDYGNGNLNMISGGYNNKIRVNGVPNHSCVVGTAKAGNFHGYLPCPLPTIVQNNGSDFSSSTNHMLYNGVYYWNTDSSGYPLETYNYNTNTFTHSTYNGAYVFNYEFRAGTFIGTYCIQSFKLTINGSDYSLAECVSNGYIRPIVLTQSWSNGNNNFVASGGWTPYQNTAMGALNIYNNTSPGTRLHTPYDQAVAGTASLDSTYGSMRLWLTLKPGYNLTGCKVVANWHVFQNTEQYKANDGLVISCCPEEDLRITMDRL